MQECGRDLSNSRIVGCPEATLFEAAFRSTVVFQFRVRIYPCDCSSFPQASFPRLTCYLLKFSQAAPGVAVGEGTSPAVNLSIGELTSMPSGPMVEPEG